jgi:hypothetical protein
MRICPQLVRVIKRSLSCVARPWDHLHELQTRGQSGPERVRGWNGGGLAFYTDFAKPVGRVWRVEAGGDSDNPNSLGMVPADSYVV